MTIRPSHSLWTGVFYLLLAGLCTLPAIGMDGNFTSARFAFNLTAGRGLVFFTPATPIMTYPLIPVAFTLAGHNPLWAAWAISTLAAAAGGFFLARLVEKGWWVGALYILATGLSPSAVTLTVIALGLAALLAAVSKRWLLAGLLIALALLADPPAIMLLLLLILYAIREGDLRWRFVLPALAIPMLILGVQTISLGGPGTVILAATHSQLVALALPALAILMLARSRTIMVASPHLALIVAWSGIGGALTMLAHGWPSAIILPGVVILIALGRGTTPHPKSLTLNPSPVRGRGTSRALSPLAQLLGDGLGVRDSPPLRPSTLWGQGMRGSILILALSLDLALNLLLPTSPLASAITTSQSPAPQIGAWIESHTGVNSLIALENPALLPFELDRPILDLREAQSPLDGAFFLRYAPGALIIPPDAPVAWAGFPTTYTRAQTIGSQAIYVPVVRFSPLDDHSVDVIYAANLGRSDLRLRGVGIASTIRPNDRLRVRLDWDLAYAPSFDMTIRLQLLDDQGQTVTQAQDTIPAAQWHAGQQSTYHLMIMPANVRGDHLALHVGVSIRGGDLGDQPVTLSNFLNQP